MKISFILIPNIKDSSFYKFLIRKYPFLFNFNTFPLILAQTISLIEAPNIIKNKNYIRKTRSKNVQLIETYTKASNRNYILTFKNTPLFSSIN